MKNKNSMDTAKEKHLKMKMQNISNLASLTCGLSSKFSSMFHLGTTINQSNCNGFKKWPIKFLLHNYSLSSLYIQLQYDLCKTKKERRLQFLILQSNFLLLADDFLFQIFLYFFTSQRNAS